jgi:hypothetical protein
MLAGNKAGKHRFERRKNDKGFINGHGLSASRGEFSPDGRTLAIVIKDGITLWHVPSQQEMITFGRQWGGDLFFSPDGTLATGLPSGRRACWSLRAAFNSGMPPP